MLTDAAARSAIGAVYITPSMPKRYGKISSSGRDVYKRQFINRQIGNLTGTFGDDMLNQARCADETEGASGSADSGVNGSGIFYFIRYKNIADTFARQRQRFTVGVADQRVFIIFGQIRNFHVPIDEFAVRFIGNQINRVAVEMCIRDRTGCA